MVLNREEAVQAALKTVFNVPRMCQAVTRNWFGAPSVGDVDGDGAADAEDGWKSEPDWAKRPGDRKPPRGYPVAWGGGSSDNGHRAISLGPNADGVYMIRSTDAAGIGRVGTVPLSWVEREWGMPYLGWSKTISGIPIPDAPETAPPKKPKKPTKVSRARALVEDAQRKAKKNGLKGRARRLNKVLKILPKR